MTALDASLPDIENAPDMILINRIGYPAHVNDIGNIQKHRDLIKLLRHNMQIFQFLRGQAITSLLIRVVLVLTCRTPDDKKRFV